MSLQDQINTIMSIKPECFEERATEEEIEELRNVVGELPDELLSLLKSFNGEINGPMPVFGNTFFLSVDGIIKNYEIMREVEPEEDED